MADFQNIPANTTEFVPTVGQPSQVEQDKQQRIASQEAQKVKDDTSIVDLYLSQIKTGKIGWVTRYSEEQDVPFDPTFVGKPYEDAVKEMRARGVPESQMPLFEKARSKDDMERLYGYAMENAEADKNRAQFGMLANFAVGLVDPSEVLIGAVAAPLSYGAKATRLVNAVRAGTVGAGFGIASEGMRSQYDPTVTTQDYVSAAALSFGIGGLLGAHPGETGALQKSADALAHERPSAGGVDNGGAKRVGGSHVDTMDGPDVPVADWQQAMIDEAYTNAGKQEVVMAKGRVSLAATLGSNKDAVVSNEFQKLLRDSVGYKDKSVTVKESATELANRTRDVREVQFRRTTESAWAQYKKDQGITLDFGKEEFMDKVGRAMRDPSFKGPEGSDRIRAAAKQATDELWTEAHAARVPGYESPTPPKDNWLPRVHSAEGWIETIQNKAIRFDTVVNDLLAPAIRKGFLKETGTQLSDEDARMIADAIGRRGYDKATGSNTANPKGAFAWKDVDTLEHVLTDAGVSKDRAEALLAKFRTAEAESSKLGHTKRRTPMDESFATDLQDEYGNTHRVSVADLLDNNVDRLVSDHNRTMSGWIALQKKVGVGTPKQLEEYRDFLIKRSKDTSGTDITRKADIVFNSILGHSTSDAPDGALTKWARRIRNHNYLTTMLKVGFSMMEGLGSTLGSVGFRNFVKELPAAAASLRRMRDGTLPNQTARFLEDVCAPGTDLMRNPVYLKMEEDFRYGGRPRTRMERMGDAVDNTMAYAKRFANIASGMQLVQELTQRVASRGVAAKMIDLANARKLSKSAMYRLRNDGVTEEMQAALFNRLKGKSKVDEIEADWHNWTPDERSAFSAYVYRTTKRAVTEGDVSDTAQIMHSEVGKLIWQFRSFMTNSYEISLMNGVHMRDWQTASMWMGSTFFAGVGMAARNYLTTVGDPELRDKLLDPDELAKQAFQQASYSSIFPMMIDTVARDMHVRELMGGEDKGFFDGGRGTGLDTGIASIPALSTAKSLYTLIGLPAKIKQGEVSKKDIKDSFKLLWFNNMIGVQNGINAFANHAADD